MVRVSAQDHVWANYKHAAVNASLGAMMNRYVVSNNALLTAQPCQQCLLRDTADQCFPAGSSSATKPYDRPHINGADDESKRLRANITSLEKEVEDLRKKVSSNSPVRREASRNVGEAENWERLIAILPPMDTVEIMLEFLHQEVSYLDTKVAKNAADCQSSATGYTIDRFCFNPGRRQ